MPRKRYSQPGRVRTPPRRSSSYLSELVLWLNAASGTASYDRVRDVHGLLLEIQDYVESASPRKALDQKRLINLEQQLYARLNVYEFTVCMSYWRRDGWTQSYGCFAVKPYAADSMKHQYSLSLPTDEWGERRVSEGEAISLLLTAAKDGRLGSLRKCEQCKKNWRISVRNIDRFCGAACRVKNRLSSEGNKDRQRANQREYRRRLRERADREAAVLQLQKGKR